MAESPVMAVAGRRIAITGYGVVAPCGIGKDAFWRGLLGPGIETGRKVEIEDWDPTPYFDNPKQARRTDRVEHFALAAAMECFEQAGRPDVDVLPGLDEPRHALQEPIPVRHGAQHGRRASPAALIPVT